MHLQALQRGRHPLRLPHPSITASAPALASSASICHAPLAGPPHGLREPRQCVPPSDGGHAGPAGPALSQPPDSGAKRVRACCAPSRRCTAALYIARSICARGPRTAGPLLALSMRNWMPASSAALACATRMQPVTCRTAQRHCFLCFYTRRQAVQAPVWISLESLQAQHVQHACRHTGHASPAAAALPAHWQASAPARDVNRRRRDSRAAGARAQRASP